ncbi:arginine--tRNA ligase [Candidatus Protochlamydia phocaeensis]|uniref:arginine--tRNA ligase n=1 Tax=Candidatus Protochlamydia phocaeensis TaxID=1414722 RepID=UPI0008391584|nr:arginine--tRNA ligase [Candidatus Protochlamydia phocaeensis]
MKSLLNNLIDLFQKAAKKAFPELDATDFPTEVTPSTQGKFGHYQYNSAMKLTKILKQNPRQIAEKIVENLDQQDGLIAQTEIAGPGFINITLNKDHLSQRVDILLRDSHLGIDKPAHQQRIIIDFSSPNVAKEMHVGHLRSTIIGDSLARLFEFLGYDVLRLNHLGDWGTAFGMLIAYMKEEAPDVLTGKQKTDLTHLVNWYRASKKKFDEDPDFKRRAQLEVVALQQGQPQARHAWQIICEISSKAYKEIYDLLGVKLIDRGESFYNPFLAEIVADLEKKGLVQISEGAKCIFVEGFQNREGEMLPLMVQKSDGGYNYDTTDMAAIYHRIHQEKGDRLIYVTDAGQSTHFQMIFKAAEMAGYLNPKQVRTDHVPFGLVLGPDGKKFRTRAGETERLIDLIQAAIDHAEKILIERNPEMDEAERQKLAHALGVGAIKYADLSTHRMSDYTFSYDRMLRFEGNTAAFLMYAYVRVAGIKRRLKIEPASLLDHCHIHLEHPSEIDLGLHLLRFDEALEAVANDLLPNRLTDYLYTLAEKFNAFFRDCRVEGSPQQNERLLLCEATARVLKQGLDILGVPTVERM